MAKRKRRKPPAWLHDDRGNAHFIQLFASMLESEAFKDLSPQARALYLYCVRNAHGEAMRADAPLTGGTGDERLFYMTKRDAVAFGLYSPTDTRGLSRDLSELCSHGFTDLCWSGQSTRSRNVYRLSDRWKKWGTSSFSMPEALMTTAMRNRLKAS